MADKIYKSFDEVKTESGIEIARRYQQLKLRDKFPLINKLEYYLTIPNMINKKEITDSYIATWDENGNLSGFNPNPKPQGLGKGGTYYVSTNIEYTPQ